MYKNKCFPRKWIYLSFWVASLKNIVNTGKFYYFPKIGYPISDMFKIFDEGTSTLHFPNITLSIEHNNSQYKRKSFNAWQYVGNHPSENIGLKEKICIQRFHDRSSFVKMCCDLTSFHFWVCEFPVWDNLVITSCNSIAVQGKIH